MWWSSGLPHGGQLQTPWATSPVDWLSRCGECTKVNTVTHVLFYYGCPSDFFSVQSEFGGGSTIKIFPEHNHYNQPELHIFLSVCSCIQQKEKETILPPGKEEHPSLTEVHVGAEMVNVKRNVPHLKYQGIKNFFLTARMQNGYSPKIFFPLLSLGCNQCFFMQFHWMF